MDSLVVCSDRQWGRRDRLRCGIEGLSLGGGLSSVDTVIVGSDRLECGPVISNILRREDTLRFRRRKVAVQSLQCCHS
jgi:hypothetical protein